MGILFLFAGIGIFYICLAISHKITLESYVKSGLYTNDEIKKLMKEI